VQQLEIGTKRTLLAVANSAEDNTKPPHHRTHDIKACDGLAAFFQ
jgi:hypothetical protein